MSDATDQVKSEVLDTFDDDFFDISIVNNRSVKDLITEHNSTEYFIATVLLRLTMHFVQSAQTSRHLVKCTFDRLQTAQLLYHCLKKVLGECITNDNVKIVQSPKGTHYEMIITDNIQTIARFLQLINARGGLVQGLPEKIRNCDEEMAILIMKIVFLARGTTVKPDAVSKKVEFTMPNLPTTIAFVPIFEKAGIIANIHDTKDIFRLTLRGNANILKFLELIGAHDFHAKWAKQCEISEQKASINRAVNFDTANITKSVDAATISYQNTVHAFEILDDDEISPKQRIVGELRLENPYATLSEISQLSQTSQYPATKHTVLSRLNRLHSLATEKKKELESTNEE